MTQGGCPSRCDRATVAAKLVAKLTVKLNPGLRSRPSGWPSSRPSSWPSWSWSSRWMTTLTSPEPGWRNRAPHGIAPSRTLRQRRRQGLNGQKCPKCTDQRRSTSGVEVSVQTSVEVRVEGGGARWERTSSNREWLPIPDRRFFCTVARIGNLTGKVTGNPEVHDRRAVANGGFDRQSLG